MYAQTNKVRQFLKAVEIASAYDQFSGNGTDVLAFANMYPV